MVRLSTTKNGIIRRALVLIAVWAGLVTCMVIWGDTYSKKLIPVYKATFETVSEHFYLQSLTVVQSKREKLFQAHVVTAGVRRFPTTQIPAGLVMSSATLQAHAYQPFIIFYSVLLVWPMTLWWHRMALLILSIPVFLGVVMMDVPFVLLGALEDLTLFQLDPGALSSSLTVRWMNLMNSGGRLVIPLVTALAVVGGFRVLARKARKLLSAKLVFSRKCNVIPD